MSIKAVDIQCFLYKHLEQGGGLGRISLLNKFLIAFICFSSLLAILETETAIRNSFFRFFEVAEIVVVTVFITEYILRFLCIGVDEKYSGFKGRARFLFSAWSLIDLLAILPFFLTGLTQNTFILRVMRLLRILRLAKLGRYSTAASAIVEALDSKKHELVLSGTIAFVVMLISSSFLYVFEGALQPDAFGSIMRSFWWSIATLTTVGYGDVTPITAAGRVFAGLTAIAGIGLIAMPTGILAAAFSEAIAKKEDQSQE